MTAKRILFIASVVILILSTALPVSAGDANPPLDLACSLRVIFVMDESGSIRGEGGVPGILTEVRDAANGFMNALAGTGSEIAIIEFNTTARLAFDYMPLTSANVSSTLSPYVNGTTGPSHGDRYDPYDYTESTTPSFYTNWEDALDMVASINASQTITDVADLVVFFTDGNPTAHNDPNAPGGVDIDTDDVASHVPDAELAANVVKGQGSHMFVIGVPNPSLTHAFVHAISGPVQFPQLGDPNFGTADYALTTSDLLFESLRGIAFALCRGSVSVTKTINDGHDVVTVPGWAFSATVRVSGDGAETDYDWMLPEPGGSAVDIGITQSGTTDENGQITWQWKPYETYTTTMVLDESKAGTSYQSGSCTRQALGQPNPEAIPVPSLPVTITFGLHDIVTCNFQNSADGVDWGDAVDTYGTLASAFGPRHVIVPGASVLGASVDPETDGKPSILVNGDDLDNVDDEDGVMFPDDSIWNDGTGEIDVTASGPGCLNAWVDFNNFGNTNIPNGLFIDQGEHVISNTVVITGTKQHTFMLPVGEVHDVTLNMRFRLTPLVDGTCNDGAYLTGGPSDKFMGRDGEAQGPSPYFLAIGGEIEDHTKTLGPTAITLLDVSTDSEVSRLPFLAFAVLLAISMLVLAHYRRRQSE